MVQWTISSDERAEHCEARGKTDSTAGDIIRKLHARLEKR